MASSSVSILDRITAGVVIAVAITAVLHLAFAQDWAKAPSEVSVLALLFVVMHRFGLREWLLLGVALALTTGLAMRAGGTVDLHHALGQGAYFTAFIMLLMLLREGAVTSRSVLTVGAWITRQPPGRRFIATWFGGHIAGILMNFGAVSLLAPLVQRGVRAYPIETPEDERRAVIRERRQLSALIRGFSPVITWAPTTLTQVIVFSAVPGLDTTTALLMGISFAAMCLVIGWIEDRLRWGPPRVMQEAPEPFPRAAALDLMVVYGALVLGAGLVLMMADLAMPLALMVVAPVMLVGWVITQNLSETGAPARIRARLTEITLVSVPRMAKDAWLLGVAGYIGICAARLAPVDLIARWTESAHLPGWVFVAGLPVLITLAGQIALSPMMMVVFLAAVVSALPTLPAPPEYIAAALSAGWALSMTSAPNATGALLLSGATGISSTTLTWRWNGVYSLCVLFAFGLIAWIVVP